jgi:ApbE superfamily uncharacterized protein (UPF0280 family)
VYEPRLYREWVETTGLVTFHAVERESDLEIRAHRDLRNRAREALREARAEIEREIARRPEFATSFSPLPLPASPEPVVADMLKAARAYGVGPMAAVAGAVAETVGQALLQHTPEVIVENGGDIFLKMDRPVEVGLYAGKESPFTGVVRLRLDPEGGALGVCTSSGTVGHSTSFGCADAVVAVARNAALADAAATAVGNRVKDASDVEAVLAGEQERGALEGLLIAVGRRIGAWGKLELLD